MATVEAEKEIVVVPFGIEADHPRSADLVIQCIPGCRLRGSIDGTRAGTDAKTGEPRVPLDQARHLAGLPKVPGMRLFVDPADLTYEITDPLHDNEQLCERIEKHMRENTPFRTGKKIRGVEPQKGKLDSHRMKSLCREMLNLLKVKHAKMFKGPKPELEEVESLPGHFLLNPGLRTHTTQPTYEKDWDDWVARLSHSGG